MALSTTVHVSSKLADRKVSGLFCLSLNKSLHPRTCQAYNPRQGSGRGKGLGVLLTRTRGAIDRIVIAAHHVARLLAAAIPLARSDLTGSGAKALVGVSLIPLVTTSLDTDGHIFHDLGKRGTISRNRLKGDYP